MKIVWSPLAIDRISEIAEYIAMDSPQSAEEWVGEVFSKVESLAEHPKLGRVVPELGRLDVRELIHGDYRIIYRVAKEVSVLTVRHGARRLSGQDIEES